jgi:hypothetical protein
MSNRNGLQRAAERWAARVRQGRAAVARRTRRARQVVEALRPRWPKGNADRWR